MFPYAIKFLKMVDSLGMIFYLYLSGNNNIKAHSILSVFFSISFIFA